MKYAAPIIVPLAVSLSVLTGCALFKPKPAPLPTMFSGTPTLNQLIESVHKNGAMMRSLSADDVTVRVPDVLVPIKATLRMERAKRFRLIGGASTLTGNEVDFGSNDELFWIWAKRLPTQQTFYCRHEQFATCPARQMVPFDPEWIFEAIGMINITPNEAYDGPFPVDGENLMFVTQRVTPAGTVMKKTTVQAKTGCIVRQEIYSPNGTLAAVAVSSNHAYDGATGILYARHVEFQCQGATGSISIDINDAKFNVPINPAEFMKPNFPGYPDMDICSPQFINMLGTTPPTAAVLYAAPTVAAITPSGTPAPITPAAIASPSASPYASPSASPYHAQVPTAVADQSQTAGASVSTQVR